MVPPFVVETTGRRQPIDYIAINNPHRPDHSRVDFPEDTQKRVLGCSETTHNTRQQRRFGKSARLSGEQFRDSSLKVLKNTLLSLNRR
jgi:hypothetical protein